MSVAANEFVLTTLTDDRNGVNAKVSPRWFVHVHNGDAQTHFASVNAQVLTYLSMKTDIELGGFTDR